MFSVPDIWPRPYKITSIVASCNVNTRVDISHPCLAWEECITMLFEKLYNLTVLMVMNRQVSDTQGLRCFGKWILAKKYRSFQNSRNTLTLLFVMSHLGFVKFSDQHDRHFLVLVAIWPCSN